MPAKVSQLLLTPKQLNQIHAHIITNPRPHLLNSLLRSFTLSHTPQNSLLVYNQMVLRSTSHDHFTYTYALRACSLVHAFEKGREIQARIIKSGDFSDIFILNSMMHLFISSNDIVSARRIFDLIIVPDVVSYTTFMSGLVKSGLDMEALIAFMSMDVKPTSTTLVTVLAACSNLRELKLGKAIHGYYLRKLSAEGNIFVNNAILNLYAICGSYRTAHKLFETMGKRDVITWTTMLGGYAHRGHYEAAINTFQDMLRRGEVQPNEATLVNVLYACASIGEINLGKWLHSYMDGRHDVMVDGHVGNSLVNMYAKCGEIGMALKVFDALKYKDLVSWSTILGGLAMNGYGKKAFEAFTLMLCHGILPDGVTFVSLLSACSHAGLIDRGMVIFKAMNNIYGITPELEHYTCIIDMYGRAGRLAEAEAFVRDMPVKPDGPVLGALLNACKLHGNERMLDHVKQSLVGANHVSGGTYALLSNMYSNFDRWTDADDVRNAMTCMGLRKTAGRSWVNVGGAS